MLNRVVGDFKYLTQGNTVLPLYLKNPVLCKALRDFTVFFLHAFNWTYVLFNVERLVAIALSLRTKSKSNVHLLHNAFYFAILVLIGLLLYAFAVNINMVGYTAYAARRARHLPRGRV